MDLVKEQAICKICGNKENNMSYKVRERQINRGEIFRYLYCSYCGTLQLYDDVKNISDFYPGNYYSFHMKSTGKIFLPRIVKHKCVLFVSDPICRLPESIENILRDILSSLMKLYGTNVKYEDAILDVGGGNGKWLNELYSWGFRNLTCIDLYGNNAFPRIKFIKCDIRELNNEVRYDLITFHHSFEHMADPKSILRKVKEILNPTGVCLIRIPICECEAWNIYHENWYEIDAPRHLFLYTERSLRLLCEEVGLSISRITYDSKPGQFIISENYRNSDLSLSEIERKTKWKRMICRAKALKANREGKGDRAVFYIKHKE